MPIDLLTLGAALLAGLLGGVHCGVMCGGIASGLGASSREHALRNAFVFNFGRVLGYTIAGVIVGGFGGLLLSWVRIPGLATTLRVLLGLVLVLAGLRLLDGRDRLRFLARPANAFWQRLQPLTRALMPVDSSIKRLLVGMLWGWLPCGLSATLLTAAWLEADPLHGGLLMASFGLGTLPLMIPLTWSGARTLRWLQRPGPRRGAALMLILAGILTAAAPWLAQLPLVHDVLVVMGCRSL